MRTKREAGPLAAIRKKAGLGQREAAQAAGIAPETLCRIEKATSRPSEETMRALAKVYHVALHVVTDAYTKTLRARLKAPIFSS